MTSPLVSAWAWLTTPPVTEDAVASRRASLLLRVLTVLLFAIPCTIGVSMFGPDNTLASNATVYLPVTAALLALVAVVRRGWLDLAG